MLGKLVYWLAVVAISLALLVALVLFFESRDDSALGQGGAALTGLRFLGLRPRRPTLRRSASARAAP